MHFDRPSSHESGVAALAFHILFACKFLYKMALLNCLCAFRPRRLAQKGCRSPGAGRSSCKFSRRMALMTCPCAFRLRRLAQNETSHTEILPRGSLYRDLAKRAPIEIYRVLVRGSCRRPLIQILSRDLAKRAAILLRELS